MFFSVKHIVAYTTESVVCKTQSKKYVTKTAATYGADAVALFLERCVSVVVQRQAP